MLERTGMIFWKEFIHILRDPRQLAVVVLMPIIMLVMYGYAINLDVNHVKMAIYDQNMSPQSRDLIGAFADSTYFDIAVVAHSDGEITNALQGGRAQIALIIPVTYSRDLASGHNTPIQAIIDGSDSTTASTVGGYFASTVQQQSAKIIVQALARVGRAASASLTPIDLQTRYWYNPELKSVNFIVPGLIAVILMQLATLLTSATIVRERERGSMEPLLVSPVRPLELMLGKLIPYAAARQPGVGAGAVRGLRHRRVGYRPAYFRDFAQPAGGHDGFGVVYAIAEHDALRLHVSHYQHADGHPPDLQRHPGGAFHPDFARDLPQGQRTVANLATGLIPVAPRGSGDRHGRCVFPTETVMNESSVFSPQTSGEERGRQSKPCRLLRTEDCGLRTVYTDLVMCYLRVLRTLPNRAIQR
jgi:hypothetical protein